MARSKRRGDYLFGVLFLGLDRFKLVNESLGHVIGDQLLIAVGEKLKSCLRAVDTIARLGGDEFCIIFPHTPASEAASSVERIRRQLEKLVFSVEGGMPFSITASFGIAELTSAEVDETGLFENADQALYQAKRLGRNRSICSAVQKEV